MQKKIYDCVVVGGGIGGLMAAIYLQRFCLSIKIFDNNKSRSLLISKSHNFPTYPKGISGKEIIGKLRKQLRRIGGKIETDTVLEISSNKNNKCYAVKTTKKNILSRYIIIATGVKDNEPHIAKLYAAIEKKMIRHCLICDGYEARDKSVAIIGYNAKGAKEAINLATYTAKVHYFNLSETNNFAPALKEILLKKKIKILNGMNINVIIKKKRICAIQHSGNTYHFDVVYSALGFKVNDQSFKKLKIIKTKEGCIVTNNHQQTNLKEIYAVGDITCGIKQMCHAQSQGAIAAIYIYNKIVQANNKKLTSKK